ncbi:short-chain dehydrogenase [Nostoc sp. 3335mG]|nr:short-chain dehydrogenase [Nostoc sp. 3335mG]
MSRRRALISGAAGGMGRACARLFGATHDLVLTDAADGALADFSDALRAEGYTVPFAQAGDLGDDALLADLAASVEGAAFTLVHTAGLSPSMADWRPIMAVNLVATEKLLRAIEPALAPGSVAVLIASMAGHMAPALPDARALLADPLAPDFLDRIGAVIEAVAGGVHSGAAGLSYMLSKQAVLGIVERRAMPWGAKGARIVSISPGMILTPMGRKELAETPGAQQLTDAAPAGRAGTASDVALAAQFLASDAASFITGSDLKVDGGGTAVVRAMAG